MGKGRLIRKRRKMVLVLMILIILSAFSACDSSQDSSSDNSASKAPVTSAEEKTSNDEVVLRKLAIEYAGKKIGVVTGTVFDEIVAQYIPDANIEYYNSNADMALAVKKGKINAYVADEPMARLLCKTYTDQYITGVFEECPYAFMFPKDGEKTDTIRPQMDEFIEKINSDGTLKEIDEIWFGDDESKKVVDTSDLTGENGTLEFSMASVVGAPFVYIKDNKYVGYDVDIAVRFCREYGYGINITDYNASGLFSSISSGLADFGASSVCVTEERKEEMDFSEPDYYGSVVLVTKQKAEADVSEVSDSSELDSFDGKTVGAMKDTTVVDYIEEKMPNCNIRELDSGEELAEKLESGEIDGYVHEQPLVRQLLTKYRNHHVTAVANQTDYAYLFRKNDQNSDALRQKLNNYLKTIKKDGTIEEIDSIWFGDDESRKTIDYSGLTGENGTIKVAVSTKVGAPFMYSENGQICGYDADILFRFCREYGYGIEFTDTEFGEMFNLVDSGECILAGSCISITEDREKLYRFSEPNYNGGLVIVTKEVDEFDVSEKSDAETLNEMSGKRIGYLKGSIHKELVEESVSSPEMKAYATSTELGEALEAGKIDAYVADQPIARIQANQYSNHYMHSVVTQDNYAYGFTKNNKEYPELVEQMNTFLKDIKSSGELDEIDDIWFGDNASLKTIDFSMLDGKNGTLTMAVTTAVGAPLCYINDGEYLGYDIDIAVRFCEKYGYKLQIQDYDGADSVVGSVSDGTCDFCGSCITVTDERKKVLDFSTPNYYGGAVIVTRGEEAAAGSKTGGFIKSLKKSFRKTFIREGRWRMFAGGLGITVLLTVLSSLLGSIIGFAVFLAYRKGKRIPNKMVDAVSAFLQMTPIVVVLMIFYYILFADSGLSGVMVCITAFSLMFACSVTGLFKAAVKAVDIGQTEAVRALGYSDTKGFLRMILPQAMPHFIPGFKSELIGLIKNTAIVGYVAVQDLTMVTDIIRARTYEAFFPLLATAIIYFIFALLMIKIVKMIEIKINPYNREEGRILKGVKR